MKKQLNIIFLSTILILCSCNRDNELIPGETTITPLDTETFTVGHLNGHIIGENDESISEALVEVNGTQIYSDANGFFQLENISLSTAGTLVKVSKENYFDGFKFSYVEPGEHSMIKIKMIEAFTVAEFASNSGTTIDLGNGSEVQIPPDAIATEDGNAYTGTTIIKAHWYDPRDPDLALTMPGDLRGIGEEGTQVQLVTYGMMAVNLEATDGSRLMLKQGTSARLTFPLPADSNPEDNIPMWHLDESTGVWIEEGTATKEGDAMIAYVNHFSFWNCDIPFDAVKIKGVIANDSGDPIADELVTITDLDNNVAAYGYTNRRGVFCGFVPAGVNLSLTLKGCNGETFIHYLGILEVDTDLGTIVLDIVTLSLEGRITDCLSEPLSSAYVLMTTSRESKVLIPEMDGTVSTTFVSCPDATVTIKAVDIDKSLESDLLTHQYTTTNHNFGALQICDNPLQTYVKFRNNDGDPVELDDAEVLIINGTHIVIIADEDPYYLQFVYPLNEGDPFPTMWMEAPNGAGQIKSPHLDAQYMILDILDNAPSQVGDYVIGSVESTFGTLSAEFVLQVDELVETATVEGIVWRDTNGNGLQDAGEPGIDHTSIEIESTDPDQEVASYFGKPGLGFSGLFHSNEEGYFKIEAIVADGEYRLKITDSSGKITIPDAGDDTIDSDFIQLSPTSWRYKTASFTISAGQVIGNFGLGILP